MFTSCRSPVVVVTVNHKPFVFAGTVRLSGARDTLLETGSDSSGGRGGGDGGSGGTSRIEFYRKRQRRLAARPAVGSVDEAARHALAGARKVYL